MFRPVVAQKLVEKFAKLQSFLKSFQNCSRFAQKFSFVILSETSFLVRSKLWPIIFWGTFWKQFIFDAFTALSFDVESTLWNVGGDFPNLNHFYNVFFCQMAWFGIVSYMAFYTLCECGIIWCGIVWCGVGMARLSPTSPPQWPFLERPSSVSHLEPLLPDLMSFLSGAIAHARTGLPIGGVELKLKEERPLQSQNKAIIQKSISGEKTKKRNSIEVASLSSTLFRKVSPPPKTKRFNLIVQLWLQVEYTCAEFHSSESPKSPPTLQLIVHNIKIWLGHWQPSSESITPLWITNTDTSRQYRRWPNFAPRHYSFTEFKFHESPTQ